MKTIELEFDEYPDEVFTVTVSPVPLSAFDTVWPKHQAAVESFTKTGDTEAIRALVETFTPLAHPAVNGTPVDLLDRDPNLIFQIVRYWHSGVRSVPLPLLRGSSAGEPPPEQ